MDEVALSRQEVPRRAACICRLLLKALLPTAMLSWVEYALDGYLELVKTS